MAIALTAMATKVRARIGDKTTRRDGTSITTTFYSTTEVTNATNDAVRERSAWIAERDKTFYRSVKTYIGQTDAVSAAAGPPLIVVNEEYALPSDFRSLEKLVRDDLPNEPTVKLVDLSSQEAYRWMAGYFSGFYATYPESLSPSDETVAIVSHATVTRFRILPAPASTAYLYKMWYQRYPTEGGTNLDIPDEMQEIIALDTAILLCAGYNDEILPTLASQLELAVRARDDDYRGRDAGRWVFRRARP